MKAEMLEDPHVGVKDVKANDTLVVEEPTASPAPSGLHPCPFMIACRCVHACHACKIYVRIAGSSFVTPLPVTSRILPHKDLTAVIMHTYWCWGCACKACFQGFTPPKDLPSTDKMARELKFDDEDNSAQEAKLQLLQELSELEDLLAQRFEAMQAVKKGIHECMGGDTIHDGKTSFVGKPLPPAVSQALRHTQACYCMTCMNANTLQMTCMACMSIPPSITCTSSKPRRGQCGDHADGDGCK